MNLTKKTILALGLLAAGASFAQTTATTTTPPIGVLGRSYSEIHFGVNDITHSSKDQYGLGVAANVPVASNLDVNAGYDYGWVRGVGHVNGLSTGATAYTLFKGVRPFVGAALGYDWNSALGRRDERAVWGASVGVEIPVSVISITPRVVYGDDFRNSSRSSQQLSYGVEANYWLNQNSAVFAGVGYTDMHHSTGDTWNYSVGARYKF